MRPIRLLAISALVALACWGMAENALAELGQWTTNGPYGGKITALALSPNYTTDQTVYAAIDGGGVYKSTNCGANWIAVNTGFANRYIYALAVSPNYATDQTVYAVSYFAGMTGVYKSTDCGASWTLTNSGINTNYTVVSIVISPNYAADQTVFVGNSAGIVYKSTDRGASWTAANTGAVSTVTAFAISPNYATDQTVYAGIAGGGVYKSTNGGAGWTAVNSGIVGAGFQVHALAVSPNYASDQTIFAGTGYGSYKSTNGGASWTPVYTGITSNGLYIYAIAVSPSYASDQTIFAGTGGGVYKSTNCGINWTAVNTDSINPWNYALALSPNYGTDQTLYSGSNNGGVYKSLNGGVSWITANTGISSLNIPYIALSKFFATDQTVYAGSSVNGVFKSLDGGVSWVAINSGLTSLSIQALAVSPNYAVDQTVYVASDNVYKSTNGGTSWTTFLPGSFLSVTLSPSYVTDRTIFLGFNGGIYRSTSGGASWTILNNGYNMRMLALSPNYASDQTAYAGVNGSGVIKSTNGGTNWATVNSGITDLHISAVAISPDYATDHTLYAGSSSGGGVYKSTNSGSSWTVVNNGIANKSITSLSISPNYSKDKTLYAGTNGGGVYKSTDRGSSWISLNNGLTDLSISSLAASPNYATDSTIYAGPSSGVWSMTADTTPPVANAGGNRTTNSPFTQTASATDTDSPNLTYSWSTYSGPGTITFGSPTALTTTISASADGVYDIRFSAIDPSGNVGSSSMTLRWDTAPPMIYAGSDVTTNKQFTQTGTAIDSTSGVVSFSWSEVSGPGTITFGSPTAQTTTISASADGTYIISFTATDGAGNSSSAQMTLTWESTLPIVSAGPNKTTHAQFIQTATATAMTITPMTYSWSMISGPGNVTFGSPAALSTAVSADTDGIYTLRFTATSTTSGLSSYSDMSLLWWDTTPSSVAYQINQAHTGFINMSSFRPPLRVRWSANLGNGISYPIIAGGKVFVTVKNTSYSGSNLYALSSATGSVVWGPVSLGGTYNWSSCCYEAGHVFALNSDGLLKAFDANSGQLIWSTQLPDLGYSSAPTAYYGIVYTGGAGPGKVYALDESSGAVLWSAHVDGGDDSSPAVSDDGVYVSYACAMSYKFDRLTGSQLWNFNTGCSGGGGRTPVLYNGNLYVRDVPSNYILDASTGASKGNFASKSAPAFSGNIGIFLNASQVPASTGPINAYDVSTNSLLWSFAGDGNLWSVPVIINNDVYVGSSGGNLYAVNINTGSQEWTANVDTGIPYAEGDTGFGAGEGLLVIPATSALVAYEAVDTTPPFVNAGGDKTVNGQFTQTATATDINSPALTYQWSQVSGPGTIAFGSPTELSTTISANADGAYVLQFTATDAEGNSASSQINLTWDTTPPVSAITSPDNNTAQPGPSCAITGTASDGTGSGVGLVEVSTNGGITWNTASDTSGIGTWSCWSYTWPVDSAGEHDIHTRATDKLGNVETPGAGISLTANRAGTPELPHFNWDASIPQSPCALCHVASSTFLSGGFMSDSGFCRSCHNSSGVAHDKDLTGSHGHSVMINVTSGGDRLPTYGNITAGEYNNEPYSRLKGGNKVVCVTCHNAMGKPEDFGRAWELTATSDNKTYTLQNGGWSGYSYIVPEVYRDTSLWSGPTYSKARKAYIVDPSEYTYDETAGTITFKTTQLSTTYIYVTLDYPYLRASNGSNKLCGDCHKQTTHKGLNCLICHQAHNTNNLADIKGALRTANRTTIAVKFMSYTENNSFADGDTTYDGICEVCHTQTKYYRRDGSGFANHSGGVNYDRQNCTTCHSHSTGFSKY